MIDATIYCSGTDEEIGQTKISFAIAILHPMDSEYPTPMIQEVRMIGGENSEEVGRDC